MTDQRKHEFRLSLTIDPLVSTPQLLEGDEEEQLFAEGIRRGDNKKKRTFF
jgi:hypothetical protein